MKSKLTLVICGLAALLVSGCGTTPVADDVGQREANEIVSLLYERGITAQLVKGRGSKARYSITVPTSRFADAAAVLSRMGFPADKKPTFQELTASNGIIPASREVEALRIDRATAAEIEDLLKSQADISSASVLVRLRAVEGQSPPTATVVIQTRPRRAVSAAEVRDITARAVPGMKPEDVFVSLSEVSDYSNRDAEMAHSDESGAMVSFLGVSKVPSTEYRSHVMLFIGLSVFVGMLAGLCGFLLGQFNWIHRQTAPVTRRTIRSSGRRMAGVAEERPAHDDGTEETR
jgi:type III secretory pathway lipoprotein EscJ